MTTRFAAAMPRYFAVSRTTEIETPSPLRAASSTCSTVIAARSSLTASCDARSIAGLDAPDQAAHDAGGGDFGFEAAGLPVVLALDRVERQPRDRRRRGRARRSSATPSRTMPPVVCSPTAKKTTSWTPRAAPTQASATAAAVPDEHRAGLRNGAAEPRRERGDDRRRPPAIPELTAATPSTRGRSAGDRRTCVERRQRRAAAEIAGRRRPAARAPAPCPSVVDADDRESRGRRVRAPSASITRPVPSRC